MTEQLTALEILRRTDKSLETEICWLQGDWRHEFANDCRCLVGWMIYHATGEDDPQTLAWWDECPPALREAIARIHVAMRLEGVIDVPPADLETTLGRENTSIEVIYFNDKATFEQVKSALARALAEARP